MKRLWVIIKNTERYDEIDPKMPDSICCYGTKEQAIELAQRLTNRYSGCDYAYYVDGIDY